MMFHLKSSIIYLEFLNLVFKILNDSENKPRKISKKPYKILDAPNLQDDFYLNLLDWSDNNQIAVALDSALFVWSGCSSEVTKLY
jgi:cell division cycle 20-like protein 1 (cofactor of APC complex)